MGDDGLEGFVDADAGLGADPDGAGSVDADHVLDLLGDAVAIAGRQVDLVQHRHNLVIGVDGLVDIGQRLRLDALGAVDHQKAALPRAHAARHLVGKVDMAGRVDQVQHVMLAIVGIVFDADRVGLDGDAALALDVHGIKELLLHVTVLNRPRGLDQPVGKGRFTVVDMGHDG